MPAGERCVDGPGRARADEGIDWKAYYQRECDLTEFVPDSDPVEDDRCRAAWSVFPAGRVDSVLDAGCAEGHFCSWIAQRSRASNVVGVDWSEPRLVRARRRHPGIRFVSGELPRLPFDDGAFDVVTCIEVLEHLVDPAASLRELARVARRSVVVTVPDRERPAEVLCPHCLKAFARDGHLHRFDRERVRALAQECSLRVEQVKIYHPPLARRGLFAGVAGRAIRAIDLALRPRPGLFIAARLRSV
jgi:SAM-dependent methyltransferase